MIPVYLLAVITIFRIVQFAPSIPLPLYYGGFVLVFGYLGITGGIRAINGKMLAFCVVILGSILTNDIPAFFRPWERMVSFLMLIAVVGPLFYDTNFVLYRLRLFCVVMNSLCVITVASFVAYLLRLPFVFGTGAVQGVTVHSMLLGPIAGISLIYLIAYYFTPDLSSRNKRFIIAAIVIAFLTCMLAASRGALLATIGGAAYFIYKQCELRGFIKIGVILLLLGVLATPLWMPYAEGVIQKQANNVESGGTLSSREGLWQDRIAEFKSSPLIGVGFASFDTSISKDSFQEESGGIEPGSGWLFVLSSLGLLGFLLFAWLLLAPIVNNLVRSEQNPFKNMIFAIGVLISFHLLIEGYTLSSGGFMFFVLWLILGIIQPESMIYFQSSEEESE